MAIGAHPAATAAPLPALDPHGSPPFTYGPPSTYGV